MMPLLRIMMDKLTSAYNKSPAGHIGKLFSILAEAMTGIKDTFDIIALWRSVDHAKGTTLDRIGCNFGVQRGGASDAFFRLLIKVKVTALLSGGDIDTIINTVSTLLNIPPAAVSLTERYPAKVIISVDQDLIDPEYLAYFPLTASIIFRLVAAGIGKRMFQRQVYVAPTPLYSAAATYQALHYKINPRED